MAWWGRSAYCSQLNAQADPRTAPEACYIQFVSFTVAALLEVLMMTLLAIKVLCELTALSTGKWNSARRVDCLTLNRKRASRCLKASVNIYQSRRRNVLEDLKFLLLLLLLEFVFCQNILGLLMQNPYTLNLSDVPHCCASSPYCQLLAYYI